MRGDDLMSKTAREVIMERKEQLGKQIDGHEKMGNYKKAEETRERLKEVNLIERELKR